MKIKPALAAMLFCVCVSTLNAQTKTRKGHFVLTTNLLEYSINSSHSLGTQTNTVGGEPVTTDSNTSKSTQLTASFNVYAGFFLSDRVCLGFGMNTIVNASQYMLLPNTTYATFFRYYFNKPDTSGFDFYMEGNIGAGYASTSVSAQYSSNGPNNTNTYGPYTNSTGELYGSIGLCASYHISKHWCIAAVAAFSLTTMKVTYGAYTVQANNNGTIYNNSYPESANKYFENSENFRLRLEFCM